jgi:hypothetical protein
MLFRFPFSLALSNLSPILLISCLSLFIPIIISSPCFSFSSLFHFLVFLHSLFTFLLSLSLFYFCLPLSFYLSLFHSLSLFATYFSPCLLQEPDTTTPSLCVLYVL